MDILYEKTKLLGKRELCVELMGALGKGNLKDAMDVALWLETKMAEIDVQYKRL